VPGAPEYPLQQPDGGATHPRILPY
jgi:hypothetical protein